MGFFQLQGRLQLGFFFQLQVGLQHFPVAREFSSSCNLTFRVSSGLQLSFFFQLQVMLQLKFSSCKWVTTEIFQFQLSFFQLQVGCYWVFYSYKWGCNWCFSGANRLQVRFCSYTYVASEIAALSKGMEKKKLGINTLTPFDLELVNSKSTEN